jgi:hypothetical protein
MRRKEVASGKARIGFTKRPGTASVPDRLRYLNRTQLHAVLATAGGNKPLASLIAFALTNDRSQIVFATPRGTTKVRNIRANPRVSLLIDTRTNSAKDYAGAEAVTIFGPAREIREKRTWDDLAGCLVRKHPDLRGFIHAPTTALFAVSVDRCVHVGRFQTVTDWVRPRSTG